MRLHGYDDDTVLHPPPKYYNSQYRRKTTTVSTAERLQALLHKTLMFYTTVTLLSAQKRKWKTKPSTRTQNSLTRKARVKSACLTAALLAVRQPKRD
jgi:hypothetical protein